MTYLANFAGRKFTTQAVSGSVVVTGASVAANTVATSLTNAAITGTTVKVTKASVAAKTPSAAFRVTVQWLVAALALVAAVVAF